MKLREELAQLIHDDQWTGWVDYQFSKGTFNDDGTWTMPKWAVKRWRRQASIPYSELSESEKDNDREEADKLLSIIEKHNKSVQSNSVPTFGKGVGAF